MPTTTTRAALAATAALVLLAAGCAGAGSAGERGPSDGGDVAWTTSTDPVAAGGLVWAADDVVHLSDGSTVDVGQPMTTYVVAGDGVYFTPAVEGGGTEHGPMTTASLHFADRDGTTTDTGLTVYAESLGGSGDGRYLGLVDAASGEADSFSGMPQAIAVVVDLTTGERVVESTEVMGDPGKDDLAHDYPETYLRVRFPDADTAYVEGLGEMLHSLPDGSGREVEPFGSPVHDPDDDTNQSDSWMIDRRGDLDVLLSVDGERVRPRTGTERWHLGWWFDDRTVVGVAAPTRGSPTLVTCRVPGGACTPVEGTTGRVLQFPVGSASSDGVDLTGGRS